MTVGVTKHVIDHAGEEGSDEVVRGCDGQQAMNNNRGGDGACQETLREHVQILENSGAQTGAP